MRPIRRLRALAWSRGLSLAQLAGQLGCTRAALERLRPGTALALRLEALLGEPLDALLAPAALPTDVRTVATIEALASMLARRAVAELNELPEAEGRDAVSA